jgi:hypothetical protein
MSILISMIWNMNFGAEMWMNQRRDFLTFKKEVPVPPVSIIQHTGTGTSMFLKKFKTQLIYSKFLI